MYRILALIIFLFTSFTFAQTISGEQRKWHKITLEFTDNTSYTETGTTNPFMDRRLNVTFTHPGSGKTYVIPGFFAADGNAAETNANSGNKWHVNFAPDETGTWNYSVSFREGSNVAVTYPSSANDGSPGFLNGITGNFSVTDTNKSLPDNRAKGRLLYDGTRYPIFAETNERFIKGGPDSPENFLAYEDFDGTFYLGTNYIKSYSAHASDWNNGDPSWQSGKGTEIIGAINYLASEGMNCFSFLTMNKNQGDTRDVSPFVETGNNDQVPDYTHFDVSKLAQWEIVFTHAGTLGMFLHFKTQEEENATQLDNGNLGNERKVYYRELIARFGHHLSLNWNMGEENNSQSTSQRIAQLEYVADLDPYDHLRVVHSRNDSSEQAEVYNPLLGNASELTGVSLQTLSQSTHQRVLFWVEQSEAAGKPWPISSDETGAGGAADGAAGQRSRERKLYGTYFAGGYGVEYYFPSLQDFTLQDFRSGDKSRIWQQTKYAIDFMQSIPFDEMDNADDLISGSGTATGSNICFAKEDSVYAGYLPDASDNETIDIGNSGDTFSIQWLDPRNGGSLQNGSITSVVASGGDQNIGVPPNNTSSDWVVLLRNTAMGEASISIDDVTFTEGEDAILTVTLNGEVPGGFSVNFATQNNTAIAGDDYDADSGSVNFVGTPGETQEITISTIDDTEEESDEFFFVNLSNATNGVTIDDSQGRVTILDNDDAPTLSIDDISIEEGNDAIFTVTLDQDFSGGFTVDYTTSDDTAFSGSDFTGASGTLTFSGTANEEQTITISTTDDLEVENNETFTVTLSNPSETVLIPEPDGTGTITDNDIASTISINNTSIGEGGMATFVVTLDQATASGFTIDFSTQGGSALSDVDFESQNGSLSFLGNEGETQQISIQTLDDDIVELDEVFQVILSNVVGATVDISDPSGDATIQDSDTASLSINDIQVSEGNIAVLTVSLDNAVAQGFSVDFTTSDDTALASLDYQSSNGQINFTGNANETASINISLIDDLDVENSETFFVDLSNIQGTLAGDLSFSDAQGEVEILDNDTAILTIEETTVLEGAQAVFSVTLNRAVSDGFMVDFATADVTATSGVDYTSDTGTLTFLGNPGEIQQITITTLTDGDVEAPEDFSLTLSNPTNSSVEIPTPTVTGTIIDGNSSSLFINSNTSVFEDANEAVFVVTLSAAVANPFTIEYQTQNGTAVAGQDYDTSSGTLSFAGTTGEEQEIRIPILEDVIVEPTERFTILLDNISDTGIEVAQAESTGFILDNDGSEITISNPSVVEGETAIFEVTLSNAVGSPFSVDYTSFSGSAVQGSDFEGVSGTLNFNGTTGEVQTISINSIEDVLSEGTENFIVQLTNLQGADVIIAGNQGVGTITDDDNAELTFSNISVIEGANAQINVTLSADVGGPFTVDFATQDGTATQNQDYLGNTGTLNFMGDANETIIVNVNTINDNLPENTETFSLVFSNLTGANVNLPNNEVTITIEDDDQNAGPVLNISNASVDEGGIALFDVELSGDVAGGFSVDYQTSGDTAIEDVDYVANSSSLQFIGTDGEVQQVMIQTIDDNEEEVAETFIVELATPTNAMVLIPSNTGVGTIEDNDLPSNLPRVTIQNTSSEEGTTMSVPITLDMPSEETIEFQIAFEDITTSPEDYDTSPITVTFNPEETEQNIQIPIFNDSEFEEEETFTMLISNVSQGSIANPTVSAIGTILNETDLILYPVPVMDGTTPLTITGVGSGMFALGIYTTSGVTLASKIIEITDNSYIVENLDFLSNGWYILSLQNFSSGKEYQKFFAMNR